MPIHDRVLYYAECDSERIAINIGQSSLTYKELWKNTLSLYDYISDISMEKDRGIIKDKNIKVIAVALGNNIRFPEAYLAATAFPNICAVVDPNTPYSQLYEILKNLDPELLIVSPEDRDSIYIAEMLSIKYLVYNVPLSNNDRLTPSFENKKDGAYLICFTSGTTSFPKAYLRSRKAWRTSFEKGHELFYLDKSENTFCPCPISHGIGLYCLNEVLYSGKTFHSLYKWNNGAAYELIKKYSIDRLVVVPSMIVSMEKIFRENHNILPCVKFVLTAGSKLDIDKYKIIRKMTPNAIIQEYYGASELGFISVSQLNDDNVNESIESVGIAFPDANISIRNEHGNILPRGENGYIYVNNELIADRYLWGDDGKAFKITSEGATVGDMGYIDEYNQLHVLGRAGGMILTGGYNVYLSEVENVLRCMPNVYEAVVLALPDHYLGNKIVSVIEGNINNYIEIYEYCLFHLPKYKIPKDVYMIDKWPMTSSGKIKRTVLENMIDSKEVCLVKLPA